MLNLYNYYIYILLININKLVQNTHKATIYVKLHNEDTQKYIKKVTYTFKPPVNIYI